MRRKIAHSVVLAALGSAVLGLPGLAQTSNWLPAGSGNYNTAGNWSLGLPTAAHDLVNNTTFSVVTLNGGTGNFRTIAFGDSELAVVGGANLVGGLADRASTVSTDPGLAVSGGFLTNLTTTGFTNVTFDGNGFNGFSEVTFASNVTMGAGAFARVFNGNTLTGTLSVDSDTGGLRFENGNSRLAIGAGGVLVGAGQTSNFNNGGTLDNDGLVHANLAGRALRLGNSNVTGSGVYRASNGGTVSVGGLLTGDGLTVEVVGNDSRFVIDGGGVTGTIAGSTGRGIEFSGNGNNFIQNAAVTGNVLLPQGGFVRVFDVNTISGGTFRLASTDGGVRFENGNARLTIASGAAMKGFGQTLNFNPGGTLDVDGAASADVAGEVLRLGNSNITGSGVFEAKSGGTLAIGGVLNGDGASVAVDGNADSRVVVDGGGLTGTFAASTGRGIGFSGNGNNFIQNASVAGNMLLPQGGFVRVFDVNTVSGGTWRLASTTGGVRFENGNSRLNVASGAGLSGFGQTLNFNLGGTLDVDGTASADVADRTLRLGNSNITGSGLFEAKNGGVLSIGGVLNGEGASVAVDADPASAVVVDGGALRGTFAGSTGRGISFSGNGNNFIQNASVAGNMLLPQGGFVRVFDGNTLSVGVFRLASTDGGVRFENSNALLTVAQGASIAGYGRTLNFNLGGTLEVDGTAAADVAGGVLRLGNSNITGSGLFEAKNGGVLSIGGVLSADGASIAVENSAGSAVVVDGGGVRGSIVSSTGRGLSFSGSGNNFVQNLTMSGNVLLPDLGFVRVLDGNTLSSGTFRLDGVNSAMRFENGNARLTIEPGAKLAGAGSTLNFNLGGMIVNNGTIAADVAGGALNFLHTNTTNNGLVSVVPGGALNLAFGTNYTQTAAGVTAVDGTLDFNGNLTLADGLLTGDGVVLGGINLVAADVAPGSLLGSSPGSLQIDGPLTMGAGAGFVVELGGYEQGVLFDLVDVSGSALLDGTISVDLVNGFVPVVGDRFEVLTRASGSGGFDFLVSVDPILVYDVEYAAGTATVVITAVVPEPTAVGIVGVAGLAVLGRRRR